MFVLKEMRQWHSKNAKIKYPIPKRLTLDPLILLQGKAMRTLQNETPQLDSFAGNSMVELKTSKHEIDGNTSL